MMSEEIMNFILGPTKMGKTTFCHFMKENKLKIEDDGFQFKIECENALITERIGNEAESETKFPCYHRRLCDFPGFKCTGGEESNLNTLVTLHNELKNFTRIRLVFLVEEIHLIGGNGSLLINSLNEFINTFDLVEDDLPGILIIISKSNENFCSNISEKFKKTYKNKSNFIIEAIKNTTIKVLPFEKPKLQGDEYKFNPENRERINQILQGMNSLLCEKFRIEVHRKIIYKLISIREEYNSYPNITFTSKTALTISPEEVYSAQNILCIDKKMKLIKEKVKFHAPTIIVLPENQKEVTISIEGTDPIVEFSLSIERIIGGDILLINIRSFNNKINFPDPIKGNFDKNFQFFRLESLCVSGNWTKYGSHNNKFIDLIVYLNPFYQGKIYVDPRFGIKTTFVDIRVKLFINECMRTKDSITENFISIRMCKDIEEYLAKTGKQTIPSNLKEALEIYVINLPSIFQLFMSSKRLRSFSSKPSEIFDLQKIRLILLSRYMNLISDLRNENDLKNAAEKFDRFCRETLQGEYEKIKRDKSKFTEELNKILNRPLQNKELLDFFNFYDTLCVTERKSELYRYQITGDISNYINHRASRNINIELSARISSAEWKHLHVGNGIIVGATGAIGFGASRLLTLRAPAVLAARGISVSSIAVGAVLIIGDLGINLICSVLKSGYYQDEYRLNFR